MTVYLNKLKRLLKNKFQFILMFLMPLVVLFPVFTVGGDHVIKLGIVDSDNTAVTQKLRDNLKGNFEVVNIDKKNIMLSLKKAKVNYIIEFEKGYTDKIIAGEDAKVTGYGNKKYNLSGAVKSAIDIYVNPIKNIAAASGKDKSRFYEGFNAYEKGNIKLNNSNIKKLSIDNVKVAWGLIIMFIMSCAACSSAIILKDRENKTMFRTLCTPIKLKSYMLQSILCFFTISVVQVFFISFLCVFVLKIKAGVSVWNMILLLTVFALVSNSFGMALTSFFKNSMACSLAGFGITFLFSMLGGAWGDVNASVIKNIAKFTPVSWAMDGVTKLINNGSLYSITQDMIILLIFAVIFFMLGTWKKSDVSK